jgi:hypothetical protein
MEHVRIGQDDMAPGSYGFPGILGSITIIGKNPDFFGEELYDIVEFCFLVLGEGFGRKKVDRPGRRILEDFMEDWEIVAECFT